MADGRSWDIVDDRLNELDNRLTELNNLINKVGEDVNARLKDFEKAITDMKKGIRTQTVEPTLEMNGKGTIISNGVHQSGTHIDLNSGPFMGRVNSDGDLTTWKIPTWSIQPQSLYSTKVGSEKVPPYSSGQTNTNISKVVAREIVQKLLPPLTEHSTWSPPSREFMNKALTCQTCKLTINQVDTALVCDSCEMGHHLNCLQYSTERTPRGEWHCGFCLKLCNGSPPPKFDIVLRHTTMPRVSSCEATIQPFLDE